MFECSTIYTAKLNLLFWGFRPDLVWAFGSRLVARQVF